MKTIEVVMTQEDIDSGTPRFPDACPLCLAIKRSIPWTDTTLVIMNTANTRYGHLDLPEIAKDFIKKFDAGDPVRPIKFHLHVDVV